VFPASWDAHASLAQLEWERAKAKMGYVVPAPTSAVEDKEAKDAANAAVKDTLARLDAKKVEIRQTSPPTPPILVGSRLGTPG
jgi:hypothetical protein